MVYQTRGTTLPYLAGKTCYRLALRPPVGPICVPELTFRLLEPLGVLAGFKSVLRVPHFRTPGGDGLLLARLPRT